MLRSLSWRALDPVARATYLELAQIYNGSNNGRLFLSSRILADRLRISKDTAARKLKILQDHGLIELAKPAAFNIKARHSAEYRLTAFRCDVTGRLPSKAFMYWSAQNSNDGPITRTDRSDVRDRKPECDMNFPVTVPVVGLSGRS